MLIEINVNGDSVTVLSPEEVAKRLNLGFPMEKNGGLYFTLLYGILDCRTHKFKFVSAGHPDPIWVRNGGHVELVSNVGGPPIGMFEESRYEPMEIELAPGDRLYIISDGLYEQMNPSKELFGLDRLQQTAVELRTLDLKSATELLVQPVSEWADSDNLQDDVSVLSIERKH